jgi:DNA polymerase III subunit delta'
MGFDHVFGHEKQKALLLSFLHRERLPHALLFSGQEGIGKKRVVLEFIKHIFCEKGTACGACRPCLKLAHGTHPDLMVLGNEGSMGIDQSRMISREVFEYPYEGDKRAIVIDRADMMTGEAANALLKTLEEPPPFNIFFLITSSESSIPLTVRSRCVKIAFGPLQREHIMQYYLEVLKLDTENARLLSDIACGSIGSGLFWMERDRLSLRRRLAELVTGKGRGYLNATLLSEAITGTLEDPSMYLSFLLSFFCDMYRAKEEEDLSLVANRDVKDLMEVESADERWIAASISKVAETLKVMRYNVNKWLVVEDLLVHIMR